MHKHLKDPEVHKATIAGTAGTVIGGCIVAIGAILWGYFKGMIALASGHTIQAIVAAVIFACGVCVLAWVAIRLQKTSSVAVDEIATGSPAPAASPTVSPSPPSSPKPVPEWGDATELVHNHIFQNEKVILDRKNFRRCIFRNVTFVYQGTGRVIIDNPTIEGSLTRLSSGFGPILEFQCLKAYLETFGPIVEDEEIVDAQGHRKSIIEAFRKRKYAASKTTPTAIDDPLEAGAASLLREIEYLRSNVYFEAKKEERVHLYIWKNGLAEKCPIEKQDVSPVDEAMVQKCHVMALNFKGIGFSRLATALKRLQGEVAKYNSNPGIDIRGILECTDQQLPSAAVLTKMEFRQKYPNSRHSGEMSS